MFADIRVREDLAELVVAGARILRRGIDAMSIDEWLTAHKFTARQFAEMLGCSESTVSVWRSGKGIPSRRNYGAHRAFTRGQVRPADFFLTREQVPF